MSRTGGSGSGLDEGIHVGETPEVQPKVFGPPQDLPYQQYRFAGPEDPEEQELAEHVGAAYGEALQAAMPALVVQLEKETAARTCGRRSSNVAT